MKTITRLGVAAGTALATTAVFAGSASAAAGRGAPASRGAGHAVFVQTDNLAGNAVIAYRRNGDGTLTKVGAYPTGGLGGMLAGSVADHLASQGSLTYDARHGLLFAVNAGSDTVSVFAVAGDRLALVQVISSGGAFPVSVAVHGDNAYVLNALDGGSIQGFTVHGGRLTLDSARNRALGLDPAATPQFTHTPGQVGFTADGRQLVVTTKANGSDIDVFNLNGKGAPAAAPVVNPEPGAVPFSFVLDGKGRLLLTEAGPNAVATFTVNPDGTVSQDASAATGQAATCWITEIGPLVYASNAGSSNLAGFATARHTPVLTPLGTTATDPGTVDSAASADGHYLYAQTGVNGIVDEFAVHHGGALTPVGSVTVPGGAGGEGIVAF
jgi:6-phosphogluconolactonase (cycloisomerase 2 family)